MRKILTIVAVTMLLFIACKKDQPVKTTEQAQVKAGWTSDNNTSNYTSGTYTQCAVYNNLWCANPGYQGIWANKGNNWGIYSKHPNTAGIKSSPDSELKVKRLFCSLNSLTSNYNITAPVLTDLGVPEYAVWTNNDKYGIMLWMNYKGGGWTDSEFAFELTGTAGGRNHQMNNYTVSFN